MDECLQDVILGEFQFLSDYILNKSLFENADRDESGNGILKYVFALQTKDRFELYGDLHLQKLLADFDMGLLTFVDMGISLFN